jgi:hypothetical protein
MGFFILTPKGKQKSRTRRFKDCVKYKEKINKMETYEQKEIKELLEDKAEFGYKIKITSDNKETKWLYISREILINLYNILN